MVKDGAARSESAVVVLKRAGWSSLVAVLVTGVGCVLPLLIPLIIPGLVLGGIYGFFFDEPQHTDGWSLFPHPTINGTAFLIGNLVTWAAITYLYLRSRSKRPKPGQGCDEPLPHHSA